MRLIIFKATIINDNR